MRKIQQPVVVLDKYETEDVNQQLVFTLIDASAFMDELLDMCDTFNDTMERIADSFESIAKSICAIAHDLCNCANVQNKEASSHSPQFPPKETEESSKEDKENIPPLSPLCSPEENLPDETRVREELQLLEESFDIFWEAYGYKRNRQKAWLAWKNMSKRDQKAAIAGVEAYKADCERFARPMCHASSYLHQRRWEDDFNSGLENSFDEINGKRNERTMFTREDYRDRERAQRMEKYARVVEDFRNGNT